MKNPQLVMALTCLLGTLTAPASAQTKLEEAIVGPANSGGVYTVSPRGAHVTFASTKGSRLVVIADGVEGPLFDELFNPLGASFFSPPTASIAPATSGGMQANSTSAVIVSANGEHFAYAGRQGSEYVVIHDGKEIARGPRQMLALNYGNLTISPGGKFVLWGEMQQPASGNASWRLVMNGKPGPWSGHHNWAPVFSPDDSRYAYNAVTVEDKNKSQLIVDGKVAGYLGHTPQFTADSQVLLTIAPGNVLLVDGKPAGMTGIQLENVTTAPVGRGYAVIMRKRIVNNQGVGILYLDGKEIAGTDGAQSISFSPDGKHYALTCINPEARSAFMIVDGKKGSEYQSVADSKGVYWTPDSSKVFYTATSAGRNFLIADGQEIAVQMIGSLTRGPIVFAEKGNRYAFTSVDGSNRNFMAVVDGKPVLPAGVYPYGDSLVFSADGSHYAFVVGPIGRNEIAGLVVDGTLSSDLAVGGYNTMDATKRKNPYFVFSPDGKHIARVSRKPDNTNTGLYVDNKLVYPAASPVALLTFTRDSKHLFWIGTEKSPDRPQNHQMLYVDGQPVTKFGYDYFQGTAGFFDMDSDGVVTILATIGDNVKRFRITPAPDMNIEMMIAQAQEKQAKASSDVAAAKKKTDEDAAAAKTKADQEKADAAAKAKADNEAAQAKRKADYDAAVAAKNKARQDALDAKRLYLLNAQRAKQKLPPLTELPSSP